MKIELTKNLQKKELLKIASINKRYANGDFSLSIYQEKLEKIGLDFKEAYVEINKLLSRLFIEMEAIFKKFEIKMHPYAGTLLGLTREKSLIFWDDDIDVGVNYKKIYENFDEFSAELMKKEIITTSEFNLLNPVDVFSNLNNWFGFSLSFAEPIEIIIHDLKFANYPGMDIMPILPTSENYHTKYFANYFKLLSNSKHYETSSKWSKSIYKRTKSNVEIDDILYFKQMKKLFKNFINRKYVKDSLENNSKYVKKLKKILLSANYEEEEEFMVLTFPNFMHVKTGKAIEEEFTILGKKVTAMIPEYWKESNIKSYGVGWNIPPKSGAPHSLNRNKIIK